MLTYREIELKEAIQHACEYQKAECYQEVAHIIFMKSTRNATKRDNKILDYLGDGKTVHEDIKLEDIWG